MIATRPDLNGYPDTRRPETIAIADIKRQEWVRKDRLPKRAKIISLGVGLPDTFVTQKEAYEALGYKDRRVWDIFQNSGIERRPCWIHPQKLRDLTFEELCKEYEQGAIQLGMKATLDCFDADTLAKCGLENGVITNVGSITFATTTQPRLLCPSLSYYFSLLLRLPYDVEHTDMIGGGCFPEGFDVITEEYPQDISTTQVGTSILAHDGQFHRVSKIFKRHWEGDLVVIKPYGLPPMTPTPEHPFWIVPSRFCREGERVRPTTKGYKMDVTPKWRRADELSKADYLLLPIPHYAESTGLKVSQYLHGEVEDNKFYTLQRTKKPGNVRRTTVKPIPDDLFNEGFIRLCGLYLAEGNPDGNRHIQFSFGAHEESLISECVSLIETLGLKARTRPNPGSSGTGKSIQVRVNSAILMKLFSLWFGKKANQKHIPLWVFHLPKAFKETLVKGYRDGDGYMNPRRRCERYVTSSKVLAQQLFLLLVTMGKLPAWSIQKSNRSALCPNAGPLYRIEIHEQKHYLYSDGQYIWFPIRGIARQHFKGFVHNLEIEDVNSFVCNLVAVHNCQGGAPAIRRAHDHFMLTGRPGLVITAEICTATFFPAPEKDLENTVANAIFSDGACACLIGVDENPKHPWIWAFASEFDPQYVDYLGFEWKDGRLKVKLHKDVPKVAPELAERVVKRILAPLGLSLREIDHFIIHPGGVKVLDNIRDRLGIPEEKLAYSRQILRQQGNQSSATIASIGRLAKEKAQLGDWGLVLTMGAGFKTYAILLYWA